MGDYTYNTDHGNFLLKKENVPKAVEALLEHIDEEYSERPKYQDFESLLRFLGFECTFSDDDDVIDVYLSNSSFNEDDQHVLTDVLGPFVEDGSYLVFAFGGTSGCWAVAFEKGGKNNEVTGFTADVTTVLDHDLVEILDVLRVTVPTFYEKMLAKYGSESLRVALKEKEKSDG